jgi:hypothetical protein
MCVSVLHVICGQMQLALNKGMSTPAKLVGQFASYFLACAGSCRRTAVPLRAAGRQLSGLCVGVVWSRDNYC